MEPVENTRPQEFNCTAGEMITVRFATEPTDAIGRITYCFKEVCTKNDQQKVEGNQFSFVIQSETILNLFFFFIPGEPRGICHIFFSGSNNQTFLDPRPVREDMTGLVPDRLYLFNVV